MLIITLDPQIRYRPAPLRAPDDPEPPPPPQADKVLSIQAWDTESGARWQYTTHSSSYVLDYINEILEKWWGELLIFPEIPEWPR